MTIQFIFLLLLFIIPAVSQITETRDLPGNLRSFAVQVPQKKTTYRLSRPLIGDDSRIYTCLERNFFAFESNGSIAWTLHLNYTCKVDTTPVSDGRGRIYLIAENRVLKIYPSNIGTPQSTVKVLFGDESISGGSDEIFGFSISIISSYMFINVKNRGLFACNLNGQILWSAGPVLYRFGYRQGCKKNIKSCYFSSVPAVDQCEGSVYVSNTEGEIYSIFLRSPHFKWIRDFSKIDKLSTIVPGNNGHVYVTFPVKALLLALDASNGNVLWQKDIGPLSTEEISPIVDSNGWVSIGSLDGFIYSFSPTGVLKKFLKANAIESVVQVSPFLDCSGRAIYVSQTKVNGKVSLTIDEATRISALKPINVLFTLLVPATGSVHWSENYHAEFSSVLAQSDLHHFALDERIFLAFVTAQKLGNPFSCRTTRQKLESSCSQARHKHLSIYTGNERSILLFLLFQTSFLILLAYLVWFCCMFWRKKKLQGQNLGQFLEKRRSLRLRKKEFEMQITELEQKVGEEGVANELLEKLGALVKEREGIERKLSTTYSLGRDTAKSISKSILPLYDEKTKSYSFQGRNSNENVTIFHPTSDNSSREMSTSDNSSRSSSSWSGQEGNLNLDYHGDKGSGVKAKARVGEAGGPSLSVPEMSIGRYWESPGEGSSGLRGFANPLLDENGEEGDVEDGEVVEQQGINRRIWLKRRRTLSSTN